MNSWVHSLSFLYESRRKNYYIDNNEKVTTKEYWWKFVKRYIDCERWAYQWFQMTLDEAKTCFGKLPDLKEAGDSYLILTKESIWWRFTSCVCSSTMNSWVHSLSFLYESRRKNYYIDNNEKVTTKEYWWKFVKRYIDCERWAYQWFQMTLDEAKTCFGKLPDLKEAGDSYLILTKESIWWRFTSMSVNIL